MLQEDGDGVTQTLGNNNLRIEQFVGSIDYDKQELLKDLVLQIKFHYNYINQEPTLQLFPAGSILLLGDDGNINFLAPTSMALFTDGVFVYVST